MQQQNGSMPKNQPDSDTLEGVIRMGAQLLFLFACLFSIPGELMTRWRMGSRYHNPMVQMFWPIPLFAFIGFTVMNAARVGSFAEGFIGIGTIYAVAQVLMVIHMVNVAKSMIWPHTEEFSRSDGKPLPFWTRLPLGDKYAIVRFVYEPGLFILMGIILPTLHIASKAAGAYFIFTALAIFIKVSFMWYFAFEKTRDMLDQAYLGKAMTGGGKNAPVDTKEAIATAMQYALRNSMPAALPMGFRYMAEASAEQAVGKSVEQGVVELLGA